MKNFFKHLKTVIIHRFWVCYYCFKARLYWQGLMHDLSKFSPTEFLESVKYYQGTSSPIDACKKEKGYSLAWQHHKGINKHHYEYWQDNFDSGTTHLIMPFKYNLEMICDYLGAGRAYSGKNFTYQGELDWWNNVKDSKKAMHIVNKKFTDKVMRMIALNGDNVFKNYDYLLEQLYDKYVIEYQNSLRKEQEENV